MTAEASAPVVVTEVTKTFPGVQALSGVSFSIPAGERACLLGPNGAGKTTLIRLLTGALRPSGGTVRLFGISPESEAFLAAKRRVGIVPQAPGMYRDLTVREYLDLVRELYGRGSLDDVLDAFGLREFLDRPLAQLSGGFQRRLCMAAALLSSPELLLLDEPTVGLDPVASREVRDYLRSAMAGRTTLLCTHNLAEAEELCESAIILRQGRVLLHERIALLRARVSPQLVLGAAQGPTRLAEALARLGHPSRPHNGEVLVTLPDPRAQAPGLLRQLLAEGLDVHECHLLSPSLEDLFLDAVGKPP